MFRQCHSHKLHAFNEEIKKQKKTDVLRSAMTDLFLAAY